MEKNSLNLSTYVTHYMYVLNAEDYCLLHTQDNFINKYNQAMTAQSSKWMATIWIKQ
jgi:hypothetical protein